MTVDNQFFVDNHSVDDDFLLSLESSLKIIYNNLLLYSHILSSSRDILIVSVTRRPPLWIFTDMQKRHMCGHAYITFLTKLS